jgi:hypothetical protein
MSKLKTKSDVIEWYWIDYLAWCQENIESEFRSQFSAKTAPTVDNFWKWYISSEGPLGVKKALRFYSKTDVEYV